MTGEEMIRAGEDWVYEESELTDYGRGYDEGYQAAVENEGHYHEKHAAALVTENTLITLLRGLLNDFPAGVESAAREAAQAWIDENDDIPF